MKPFRSEHRYTLAAECLTDATKRWDELDRAAELLGFHCEGGAMGEMPVSDVIEDSPLAHDLARKGRR